MDIHVAVPVDSNVQQKETESYEKYQVLAREIKRTQVVPVVVKEASRPLGAITN